MIKKFKGFGLLEAMIAVAVVAVASTVGYSTYQDHVMRTQEEVAKQKTLVLMSDFQKQYVQTGAFSNATGEYNEKIVEEVNEYNKNNKYFSFKIYPDNVTYAHQNVCLEVTPKPDTIISKKAVPFSVDNFGAIHSGQMPNYCNGVAPEPEPGPSCLWETTFEEDKDCYCSFEKHRDADKRCDPEPEPELCTENTPFDKDEACFCKFHKNDKQCNPFPPGQCADMYAQQPIPWFTGGNGCKVAKGTFKASGNCSSKAVLGGCSGNCDRTTQYILDGAPVYGNLAGSLIMYPVSKSGQTGNGNVTKSTLCNATCNGNCDTVTIYAGPNTSYPLCNGNCKNITAIASGSQPQNVIICNGNCNGTIKIPKAWGDVDPSKLCKGGNCKFTIEKY